MNSKSKSWTFSSHFSNDGKAEQYNQCLNNTANVWTIFIANSNHLIFRKSGCSKIEILHCKGNAKNSWSSFVHRSVIQLKLQSSNTPSLSNIYGLQLKVSKIYLDNVANQVWQLLVEFNLLLILLYLLLIRIQLQIRSLHLFLQPPQSHTHENSAHQKKF